MSLSYYTLASCFSSLGKRFSSAFDRLFTANINNQVYLNALSQELEFWDLNGTETMKKFLVDENRGIGTVESLFSNAVNGVYILFRILGFVQSVWVVDTTAPSHETLKPFAIGTGALIVGSLAWCGLFYSGFFWDQNAQEWNRLQDAKNHYSEAITNFAFVRQSGAEKYEAQQRHRKRNLDSVSVFKAMAEGPLWVLGFGLVTGLTLGAFLWGKSYFRMQQASFPIIRSASLLWTLINASQYASTFVRMRHGVVDAGKQLRPMLYLLKRESSMPLDVGLIPKNKAQGKLCFRNVAFAYPSKPSVKVLHNISLTCNKHTSTGIVGKSGKHTTFLTVLLNS